MNNHKHQQRSYPYSKSGPGNRVSATNRSENRFAMVLCASMTISACVLLQSREMYHSRADGEYSNSNANPQHRHIPFHRRGGEKYALHVGHRPPKKQLRKKKESNNQNNRNRPPQQVFEKLLDEIHEMDRIQNAGNTNNNQHDEEKINNKIKGNIGIEDQDVVQQGEELALIIAADAQPEAPVVPIHVPDPIAVTVPPVPVVAVTEGKSLLEGLLNPVEEPPRDPFSCEGMMARIQQDGIQLVAFDFDKSILDLHTAGHWDKPATELVPHVRPDMKCLIRNCLERNIHVAVATFSTQKELIAAVLQEALGYPQSSSLSLTEGGAGGEEGVDNKANANNSPNIPVYGRDDVVENHTNGKRSQLILAMEGFNHQIRDNNNKQANQIIPNEDETKLEGDALPITTPAPMITAASTLLVDDDEKNVKIAQEDGYQTILFRPDDKNLPPPVVVEEP